MTKLPKATLRQMMKEEGCIRVSERGLETFREEVERYAYALANMSLKCAKHGKRQTVNEQDIKLAVE